MTEPFTIAGLPLVKPETTTERLTFLIWGQVGTGKTPLAITCPPPILYILFDNDGHKSVLHVTDRYLMLDMTKVDDRAIDAFASSSSQIYADIDKLLAAGEFKSVVFDSLTAFLERALTRGVELVAPRVTRGTKPDMLSPGLQGYGARGTLTRMTVLNLHHLCSKHNIHLCFTGHEREELNDNGTLERITIMLGGESYIQVPKNISEIWLLREVDNKRRIYLRPWNKYLPMRTRMFNLPTNNEAFFPWKFNANNWEGEGIEHWIERWRKHGGVKIPSPV